MKILKTYKLFEAVKTSKKMTDLYGHDLIGAVVNGDIKKVKKFIDNGVDVKYEDQDLFTPIIAAAIHGYLAIIKVLIRNGADVNYRDKDDSDPYAYNVDATPLIFAAWNNKIDVVEYLIQNGADMTLKTANGFDFIDEDGFHSYKKEKYINFKEWLGSYETQKMILTKSPVMYSSLIRNDINIHNNIKEEFSEIVSGNELGLI